MRTRSGVAIRMNEFWFHYPLDRRAKSGLYARHRFGAIAQLVERLHGMQKVSGSIPLSSTNRSFENLPKFPKWRKMAAGSGCPRKCLLTILATLTLASCGPSPATMAQKEFISLAAGCARQYPAHPPTMGAYERCRNQAEDETTKSYVPYLDVYERVHAQRQDIADRAAAGLITLDQANLEIAQVTEEAGKVVQQRNNQKILATIPSFPILQLPARPEMGMGMK